MQYKHFLHLQVWNEVSGVGQPSFLCYTRESFLPEMVVKTLWRILLSSAFVLRPLVEVGQILLSLFWESRNVQLQHSA